MTKKVLNLPWQRGLIFLLTSFITLVLTLTISLITPIGQRYALRTLNVITPNLNIEKVSGNLYAGLHIRNFNFDSSTTKLKFSELYIKINGKCLINRSLCVENFYVNDFDYQTPTSEISLGNFTTNLTLINNLLKVSPTYLKNLTIAITPTPKLQNPKPKNRTPVEEEQSWLRVENILSQQLLHLNNIQLPLDVDLKGFFIENFHFQKSPQSFDQFHINQLKLIAHTLNKSKIFLQQLTIDSPILKIRTEGDISTILNYPFNLNLYGEFEKLTPKHYLYDVNWTHLFLNQKNTIKARLYGQLNKKTYVKVKATGSLPVEINGYIFLTQPQMPYRANVKAKKIQYPFDYQAKRPYKFENVEVDGGGDLINYYGKVTGTFFNKQEKISVDAYAKGNISSISINKFFAKSTKTNTQALLQGGISWRHELTWYGSLEMKNLDWKKYVFHQIPYLDDFNKTNKFNAVTTGVVSNSGSYSRKYWNLSTPDIDLTGTVTGKPFKLKTSFRIDPEKLDFSEFKLKYNDNDIQFIARMNEHFFINANINAPDLGDLLPNFRASLKGKLHIDTKDYKDEINANLSGSNIQFYDLKLSKFLLFSNFEHQVPSKDLLKVNIKNLSYKNFPFHDIKLDVVGTKENHKVDLAFNGKALSGDIILNGSLTMDHNRWQGTLTKAYIKSLLGNWVPNQNFAIDYQIPQNQIDITAHCWNSNQADFCFNKPIQLGKTGLVSFNLKNMGLSLFNQLIAPQKIDGRLTGNGEVSWDKNLNTKINLNGNKIKYLIKFGAKPLWLIIPSVSIASEMKNDSITNNFNLSLYNHQNASKLGNINFNFNVANLSGERNLSGNLNLRNLSLNIFKELISKDEKIEGDVSANLQFDGNLLKPELHGGIKLSQGSASLKDLPFDINRGDFNFNFYGKSGKLTGEIINHQNKMQILGDVNWESLNNYLANLSIKAQDFYLTLPISPSKVLVKISPDITLSTTNDNLSVTGKINIPWAEVEVKGLPDTGSPTSKDLVILDGKNKTQPSQLLNIMNHGETIGGFKVNSDIQITLGDNINFKAYGLNTALYGNLQVTQKQNILGLFGRINLNKGTFKAYGQDLLIQSGYVEFNGSPTQPILNIDAIRNPNEMQTSEVTAGIYITGQVSQPKVKVYTKPATTEEEAFSYLLTGGGLDNDDLGTKESVGSALLAIGLSKTNNIVNSIGDVVGITSLNIGTTGAGEKSQVAVSGYISNRLRVSYGIGLFTGLAELTLRLRLIPNLYLQSVSSVNQAVDLFYQFEL